MNDIPFTIAPEKKDRNFSRFSVSELYGLFKGWTSIEQYIQGKQFTPAELWKMAMGTCKHELIQKCFEGIYDMEVKKEYKIDGITIVGRADMVNGEYGLEIKTSDKLYEKAKDWHEFQARMYCTMFELPKFYIVQPVVRGHSTVLKVIGEVKRNDKWFSLQVNKIKQLHEAIKNHGKS